MEKREMIRYLFIASFLVLNSLLYTACQDDYDPGKKTPPRSVLAASIYDFMAEDANGDGPFTQFLRLTDEVQIQGDDYAEILKRTGSITLFVANDEAFDAFFDDNDWDVSGFEELSDAQKKLLLKSAIINDAYSLDMLSSTPGTSTTLPSLGRSMRRTIGLDILDTIPFEIGNALPENIYWERFKEKGIHILKDNSVPTLVFFLAPFLKTQNISDADFEIITGKTRDEFDAFVYDLKVTSKDNYCKNGYVNVLESVLFPRDNMAEHLRKIAEYEDENQSADIFNGFLNRFCAPYFDVENTNRYQALTGASDSIFTKKYFTESTKEDPDGNNVNTRLPFDPGQNNYAGATGLESDMGVMFVPTDKALEDYFSEGGEGRFLAERYDPINYSLDSIPNNVIFDLVKNHMKLSFTSSLPSKFTDLEDQMGTNMGVLPEHVVGSQVCSNGIIYMVNKVYPPTEYIAVSAPVSFSEQTKIFNWAITKYEFNLYLLSMEPGNVFSFFVPTDEALGSYIDPLSQANSLSLYEAEKWQFLYDEASSSVMVNVYDAFDPDVFIRLMTFSRDSLKIRARLYDILDNHIIVGNVEEDNGPVYYQTKGGSTIKIAQRNAGTGEVTAIQGGLNLEAETDGDANNAIARVTERTANMPPPYGTGVGNGNTYFIDRIAAPPVKSVYKIMFDHQNDGFGEFFDLCQAGVDKTGGSNPVFDQLVDVDFIFETQAGLKTEFSYVRFFNNYNYTVYIPTDDALTKAFNNSTFGIMTWQEIYDNVTDYAEVQAEVTKLTNFIKFHFQDNSVYADPVVQQTESYETGTRNPDTGKFLKIKVEQDGEEINLYEEYSESSEPSAKVTGTRNIMTRDIQFTSNGISASAFVVIHQIDNVLDYRKSYKEQIDEE